VRTFTTVLFWVLMVAVVVSLWQTVGEDPRGSLRTAVFVLPLVLFSSWLQHRFKGPRKRSAMVMFYSGLFAMVTGAMLVWDLARFRSGYPVPGAFAESAVTGLVFLVCITFFAFSLRRLLRRVDNLPI
jgi:tryptophan-rich sensory protein